MRAQRDRGLGQGRRARRSLRRLAALAAVAGLAGAGCTVDTSAPVSAFDPDAAPPAERPLVIAADLGELVSLDPAREACAVCRAYVSATYETLLAVSPADGRELTGLLARSWSSDDTLTTFTFELDPDARFSDGSPVEADDVVWSWERAMAADGPAASLLTGLVSLEAPGPGTVVARFEEPNADAPSVVAAPALSVLNRDAVLGVAGEEAASGPGGGPVDLVDASAGSGPYVLVSYAEGERLRLSADDDHWGAGAGVESIVVEHLPEPGARRGMLESGQADVALELGARLAEGIKESGDLVVTGWRSADAVHLALSPGAPGGEVLGPDVRRGIGLALDRRRLAEVVANGAATVTASPIPVAFPGGDAVSLPERDVAEARRLLESAGPAGGLELEAVFPTVTPGGVDLQAVAEQVRDDLAEVGVELVLVPLDAAAWAARLDEEGVPVAVGHAAAVHPGSSQFARLFGQVPGSLWGRRAGGGQALLDEVQTGLLAAALATEDLGEQGARYGELAEAMAADPIVLPLFYPDVFLAHRSDVIGVVPSTCCALDLRGVSLRR